jgi:hypothetical protein
LDKLPIPKVMRWGMGDSKFVRPVHGLILMHGKRTIQGKVMDVESSNRTLGHRVLARGPIRLRHADDYEAALSEQGKIIASFAGRRTAISRELEKRAGGALLVAGDALLDEITSLVEAPMALAGKFDPEFLEVPQECLILSMQQHQRYVPLRDKETGELLPRFLFVSNLPVKNARAIVEGNERVLRARLSDAKFFYDKDRKTRLENRVQRLSSVVYHSKLGSQLERVERMRILASQIARRLGADFLLAEQAAWLSKADLLTEMVGEFPELQGLMGRYYALNDGEAEEVADAIADHYRPRYAATHCRRETSGLLSPWPTSCTHLAGLFGIGQTPTGDRDPSACAARRWASSASSSSVTCRCRCTISCTRLSAFTTENEHSGTPTDWRCYPGTTGGIPERTVAIPRWKSTPCSLPDSTAQRTSYASSKPCGLQRQLAGGSEPGGSQTSAWPTYWEQPRPRARVLRRRFDELRRARGSAERSCTRRCSTHPARLQPLHRAGRLCRLSEDVRRAQGPVDAFFDADDGDGRRSEGAQERLALLRNLAPGSMNRFAIFPSCCLHKCGSLPVLVLWLQSGPSSGSGMDE